MGQLKFNAQKGELEMMTSEPIFWVRNQNGREIYLSIGIEEPCDTGNILSLFACDKDGTPFKGGKLFNFGPGGIVSAYPAVSDQIPSPKDQDFGSVICPPLPVVLQTIFETLMEKEEKENEGEKET